MMLLKRITFLLQLAVCREECAFVTVESMESSCSNAHLCLRCLMCRNENTVAIFVRFRTFFGVQQGQLGNPQNMLLLGFLFGECLYLTLA